MFNILRLKNEQNLNLVLIKKTTILVLSSKTVGGLKI